MTRGSCTKNPKSKRANGEPAIANRPEPPAAEESPEKCETVSNNKVTLAGLCAVCWKPAVTYCPDCCLVGYCCLAHVASHCLTHQPLCTAIKSKMFQSADNWIGNAKSYTPDEWRYERIKTLNVLQFILKREILPYERDLLLFPKRCQCSETNCSKLEKCRRCDQMWFCRGEAEHRPSTHEGWCEKLQLYAALVRRQAEGKSLFFNLDSDQFNVEGFTLDKSDDMKSVIHKVFVDNTDDLCKLAIISQLSSGPLTINHAIESCGFKANKSLTIHLIGAELPYEGNALEAWEFFLLHSLPNVQDLKIIMIGPELNTNNNCFSYVRLCGKCLGSHKTLKVEFQDGYLYHEYARSKKFTKPDLVCAFNPGLHRSTGFNNADSWPQTIKWAVSYSCPFIFTAYTSYEAPLDLKRVQEFADVHVVLKPSLNPFASLKPDRNFISDHEAPLIFKNYYLTVVTQS